MKSLTQQESAMRRVQDTLDKIGELTRALIAPSPAHFSECHEEYLRDRLSELSALDSLIEDVELKRLAAVTLLLLIDTPQPEAVRGYYPDIIADETGEGDV